jgi:hypothetical protein
VVAELGEHPVLKAVAQAGLVVLLKRLALDRSHDSNSGRILQSWLALHERDTTFMKARREEI